MTSQKVVNNPLGSYPVSIDRTALGVQRQAVGIDIGPVDGSDIWTPSRVSATNPLPVTAVVGGGNVTVDNAAGAAAVNIQDGGNSITVDGTVTIDSGVVTIDNGGGASAVNIQDGGNSITVDGTVTASLAATVSTTGNITASAQTIPVTLGEQKFVTLDISGTYGSVALAFEISLDGTNYRAVAMSRIDANTVETVTGTISSTTRTWEAHCGAATHFRVRSTAWTSGTMAVRINNSASDAEPVPTTQTHAVTMTSTTLTAVTPGTAAANLGKQIDLVVGANDVGIAALARRRNTPVSGGGVSADGDYNTIQSNLFGGVYAALIDTAGQQQTFTTTTPGGAAVGMVVRPIPSGTQNIGGDVASDAVDSGSPVKIGFLARTSDITPVANADRVNGIADTLGKQIVVCNASRELRFVGRNAALITNTTSTALIAAGGAGVIYVITAITVSNGSATVGTEVNILDGTTVVWSGPAALGFGGYTVTFPDGLVCTANTAINAQCVTTGASVRACVSGHKVT